MQGRKNVKAGAAIAAAMLVTIGAGDAMACLPPYCHGGWFLPGTGNVPSNVEAIAMMPLRHESWQPFDVSNVSFSKTLGFGEVQVPFVLQEPDSEYYYLIVPDEALEAGYLYFLRTDDLCTLGARAETSFTASVEAEPPTELGVLSAGAPRMEEITVAAYVSCSELVLASIVDVELDLAESALPWADVLQFETYADGESWAASTGGATGSTYSVNYEYVGGSWVGRGRDRLYVVCEGSSNVAWRLLDEGVHTIEMRAHLPGSEEVVASNGVTVSLYCTVEGEPADDAERPEEICDDDWAVDAAEAPDEYGDWQLQGGGCGSQVR